MKLVKMYCENCEKETIHKIYKDVIDNIAARIFFGIFSLGVSEVFNDTHIYCTKCDKDK